MTPTLVGRWQSRLFLLGTIGLFVTAIFVYFLQSTAPFAILAGVFILGLAWDVLYNAWQKTRWDHDWPPVLQFATGIVEGILAFGLIYAFNLITPLPAIPAFWLHYTAVWLSTFIAAQSIMRLIFPRWRFRGGQWL